MRLAPTPALRLLAVARSASPSPPPPAAVPPRGAADAADAGKPMTDLRIMVPNTPGRRLRHHRPHRGQGDGGRRHHQPAPRSSTSTGAGGTVGLARTVNEKGNDDLAMIMGLGVVGASTPTSPKATLAETTPIARLIEEHGAVMVPKDSPFKTIDDLVDGLEEGPRRAQRRRRLLARRPGPPAARCSWRRPSASTRKRRQLHRPTTAAATCCPALLGDKIDFGISGRRRVRGPDRGRRHARPRATSGAERLEARRRAHPQGGRHRPGLHQLARRRRPSRHLRRAARPA